MEPELKEEIKWLEIPLLASLLLFGIITGFKFGIHAFQFNGAQLDIHSFEPFLMTYFWSTLITFFAREWKHQFTRKSPIIIMLVYNSLTIVTTILFLYTLLIASTMGGIIELIMDKGHNDSPLLGLLDYIKWGALTLIPLLVINEFFLISKLKKASLAEVES